MNRLEIMDRLDSISRLLSLESTPKHPHIDSAIGMIDLLIGDLKKE
jgi:hypothetical protein